VGKSQSETDTGRAGVLLPPSSFPVTAFDRKGGGAFQSDRYSETLKPVTKPFVGDFNAILISISKKLDKRIEV